MQNYTFFLVCFLGIWSPSPNSTPEPVRRQLNQDVSNNQQPQKLSVSFKAPTPPPPPAFWTPKKLESPTFEQKEFRPIRFESPKPQRKTYTSQRQVSRVLGLGSRGIYYYLGFTIP